MRPQGPEWKYVIVPEQKDKSTAKIQCCFVTRFLLEVHVAFFAEGKI